MLFSNILWAINVKVSSKNRPVVQCFGQRALIIYYFFRRYFVSFVLFCFSFLTFLITCEFKHACILHLLSSLFPLENLSSSLFLSFFRFQSHFCFEICLLVFSPVKTYKNLYIRNPSQPCILSRKVSVQIIFHLLTLLLLTISVAL